MTHQEPLLPQYKPLNRAWAKVELFLGLFAAGLGQCLAIWWLSRPMSLTEWVMGGAFALLLWTLGWYLALAGHRSHMYQSNNELTAFLVQEIRRLQPDHK